MNKISYQDVVDAINKIALMSDKEFTISDLFPKIIWRRIPLKDRLLLGRIFFDQIPSSVKATRKNASNQQLYIKIK